MKYLRFIWLDMIGQMNYIYQIMCTVHQAWWGDPVKFSSQQLIKITEEKNKRKPTENQEDD